MIKISTCHLFVSRCRGDRARVLNCTAGPCPAPSGRRWTTRVSVRVGLGPPGSGWPLTRRRPPGEPEKGQAQSPATAPLGPRPPAPGAALDAADRSRACVQRGLAGSASVTFSLGTRHGGCESPEVPVGPLRGRRGAGAGLLRRDKGLRPPFPKSDPGSRPSRCTRPVSLPPAAAAGFEQA